MRPARAVKYLPGYFQPSTSSSYTSSRSDEVLSSALLLVFAQTKLINFDEKCTHSSEIGKLGFKIHDLKIEDSAVDHQMAAAVPGSPEDQVDPTILRILSDLAKLPDGVEKQMLKRKLIQGVIAFTASQEDRERSSAAAAAPPQPPPPPPTRPSASSSSSSSSRAAENPSSPPAPPSNALDRWRRDKPQAAAEADAAAARRSQAAAAAVARTGGRIRPGAAGAVLPTHPRELHRGMETILRLKEQYIATLDQSDGGATASSSSASSSSSSSSSAAASPAATPPLARRTKRYEIYFLECLQLLKRGARVSGQDERPHRIWLDDKGESLFWRAEGAYEDASGSNRETGGAPSSGGRFSVTQPFLVIGSLAPEASRGGSRGSLHLVPISPMAAAASSSAAAAALAAARTDLEGPAGPFTFDNEVELFSWLLTLASIRFSYWWNATKGGKAGGAEGAAGQSHLQLWQAARVSLFELVAEPRGCSLRAAWALVDGAMTVLCQGTTTPWELPLHIDGGYASDEGE